ncbi:MAG: 16S rRNA (adenine(1518)-N(6)/adenine(1519)-N(6))-dimethyltransferase RsmA [Francisellaceae bacterium]
MKSTHTHKAKKSFGQNFLQDQNIIARIIQQAHICPDDHVIEIGPGLGALSAPVLSITRRLDVIEFDADVIPILKHKCQSLGQLNVYHQDVLKTDFTTFVGENTKKIKLIGNLPYNISSPILFHLVSYAHLFRDMHFMLQKEVVDRIVANPGNKDYGRLSVMLQYYFDCQALFIVPPHVFHPQPKVDSCIIRLVPRALITPVASDVALFEKVVKTAFSQRRKTLRNTLKPLLTPELDVGLLPIDLSLRAENLSVADFVHLSNVIGKKTCLAT